MNSFSVAFSLWVYFILYTVQHTHTVYNEKKKNTWPMVSVLTLQLMVTRQLRDRKISKCNKHVHLTCCVYTFIRYFFSYFISYFKVTSHLCWVFYSHAMTLHSVEGPTGLQWVELDHFFIFISVFFHFLRRISPKRWEAAPSILYFLAERGEKMFTSIKFGENSAVTGLGVESQHLSFCRRQRHTTSAERERERKRMIGSECKYNVQVRSKRNERFLFMVCPREHVASFIIHTTEGNSVTK